MAGKRLLAEKEILDGISLIDPSGENTALTKAFFKSMSDAEFDAYMTAIEEGRDYVSMNFINLTKSKITTANNLAVAKKLGHEFFQHVHLTDNATGVEFVTPQKYLVLDLPVRRQIQTLENKISIPADNKHVDDLTDQPTGVSKGSSISAPEILVMYAQGGEACIEEFIKFRGGDLKAMNAMDKQLMESGQVSMESVRKLNTKVKSTETLATLIKGMHFDNNFAD